MRAEEGGKRNEGENMGVWDIKRKKNLIIELSTVLEIVKSGLACINSNT